MEFLAEMVGGEADLGAAGVGAAIVFALRVLDMSIDTFRVMSLVRGHRVRAAIFGFLEAGIFIVAIAQVLRPPVHWMQMLGYASGFAVGTYIGTVLAHWVSSEHVLLRILSRPHGKTICHTLRDRGFAVTEVMGEGRDGPVPVLFSVVDRAHGREVLELVRGVDEKAFVLADPVRRPKGGFIPRPFRPWVSVRR